MCTDAYRAALARQAAEAGREGATVATADTSRRGDQQPIGTLRGQVDAGPLPRGVRRSCASDRGKVTGARFLIA
jgi:hypothetical protein